jgi:hypothetical protein
VHDEIIAVTTAATSRMTSRIGHLVVDLRRDPQSVAAPDDNEAPMPFARSIQFEIQHQGAGNRVSTQQQA